MHGAAFSHNPAADARFAGDLEGIPPGLYFAVLDGPAARSVTRLVRIGR